MVDVIERYVGEGDFRCRAGMIMARHQDPAESCQQMGLSGTGGAINIEEIPVSTFGQQPRKTIGRFIPAADDEIVETVPGVHREVKDQLHG